MFRETGGTLPSSDSRFLPHLWNAIDRTERKRVKMFYLFLLIFLLFFNPINYAVAESFSDIAEMKGHSEKKYFRFPINPKSIQTLRSRS